MKDSTEASSDDNELVQTSRGQVLADYEKRKKKWYLDVKATPCARDSLIHGILGGLTVGLLYFLKSNIVARSCDFAIGGFIIVGFGSWRYCRHKMAKEHLVIQRTVDRLNETRAKKNSKDVDTNAQTDNS